MVAFCEILNSGPSLALKSKDLDIAMDSVRMEHIRDS